MCQRELQIDGTLSERTLELPMAGLLATSPLLALCNDEVSLHRASCLTAAQLVPLYPESGLLFESVNVDFSGTGSTGSATCSLAATWQAGSSTGSGSVEGTEIGSDAGRHGSSTITRSRRLWLGSAVRWPGLSEVLMQCFS